MVLEGGVESEGRKRYPTINESSSMTHAVASEGQLLIYTGCLTERHGSVSKLFAKTFSIVEFTIIHTF